ncbi:MAG: hypothetical protein LBT87_04685 [Treponema sp.]|nr:hypothetical protein [Treponema sp.]
MAALVPHRDSRRILRAYSGELFARGFAGAWSFPWAAPLALLTRPLEGAELSFLARSVREKSLAAPGEGRFDAGSPLRFPLPGFPPFPRGGLPPGSLWGPEISLQLRAEDFGPSGALALYCIFHRPVLACAVLGAGDPPLPPAFSFGAAAVTNMSYGPLGSGDAAYSFAWEIGELHWLPALRRKRSGRTCPRGGAVPEEPQNPLGFENGPDTQGRGPE